MDCFFFLSSRRPPRSTRTYTLFPNTAPFRSIVAARALAGISYAQFAAQLDGLVREELAQAGRLHDSAALLERGLPAHRSLGLLVRAQRERIGTALDFVLELLAIGGRLDRKSTRLNSVTNAHLVCRLLLEKKKSKQDNTKHHITSAM